MKLINNTKSYYATTCGRIYRVYKDGTFKRIKPYINYGYEYCGITFLDGRRTVRIHRIIAETFIPENNKNRNQVNHINGIKTDNYVGNLEWCSQSENMKHAIRTGLYKTIKRQKHSVFVDVLDYNGNIIYSDISSRDASKLIGCSLSTISRALKCYNGVIKSKKLFIRRSQGV